MIPLLVIITIDDQAMITFHHSSVNFQPGIFFANWVNYKTLLRGAGCQSFNWIMVNQIHLSHQQESQVSDDYETKDVGLLYCQVN